jgi:hypothetical protein
MCAQVHVVHKEAHPLGVPPFTFILPMASLAFYPDSTGDERPGNQRRQSFEVLYPLSYAAYGCGRSRTCVTRVTGEVSVVYATGQIEYLVMVCITGESAKRVSERVSCGILCFGTTPPSRKAATPAGFSGPAFLCRGSNSLLSPPVKQTSGQGISARGVRGVEPRSFKSCQKYPRTPPLTTEFSEECVPYPGSPVTGKTRRIGAMRLESRSHSSRVDSRAV